MSDKKVVPSFEYTGCGFPVTIVNAPMRKIAGHWALDVDPALIDRRVLFHLAGQPGRLTGDQLRFYRTYIGHTLRDLGKRLSVSHVAILKWESRKKKTTEMGINTERVLRAMMFLDLGIHPDNVLEIIAQLNEKAKVRMEEVQMDAAELKTA